LTAGSDVIDDDDVDEETPAVAIEETPAVAIEETPPVAVEETPALPDEEEAVE
jgi:hypothetical protein